MTPYQYKEKGRVIYENMRVNPLAFLDTLLLQASGEAHIDVLKLEDWLGRKGLLKENESVKDCILRHFGENVEKTIEEMI